MRRYLDAFVPPKKTVTVRPIVAVTDTTFFGRKYGILVVRCPHAKRTVYFHEVVSETPEEYRRARQFLEAKGFVIAGVVIDGKPGVMRVFEGIPVQMCQFHQSAIVRRYLTTRPKLEAGKELRAITLTLTISNEKAFAGLLDAWHGKWDAFLKERTYTQTGKRWYYTHKRIRSAYRSLHTNLPYLFTYQNYPHLHMPNTTNSLEGSFSRLKGLLNAHRGLSPRRRLKLIREILFG